MNKKEKLINTRISRDYTQDYLAGNLNIDVSSYSRKENGKVKIAKHEWEKLAELLEVPVEEIYEPDESIFFIFKDNSTGNGNGIGNTVTNNSMPQYVWEIQKKYTEKLEEEVRLLKEEILVLKEEINLLCNR